MSTIKSKNSCCVVNCNKSYKNTTNIIFYRFPNRDYEKETKEKENGKPWRPSVHSVYTKKKTTNVLQNIARYERSINRQNQSTEFQQINNEIIPSTELELNNITTINISTQVAFEVSEESFILYCVYEGNNNVGTQASSCLSFRGYNSIQSANALKGITCVTFKIFNFLLSLLPQTNRTIISTEDTFLIMLMKVELGLSVLHIQPLVHFFQSIELPLVDHKTNNLIFWPSKTTIVDTLIHPLSRMYSHTRE
ncbi:hypothetical protein AGLY_011323 [Aphis glycines]|uniref:THAP-type domain-containing protein n=1 Tax=Aphis glycines TaxID=307491 RepID=A0A6G0TF94_APHGL|nr:hypothetical protein AGLY_011323 [Aphis glycines]